MTSKVVIVDDHPTFLEGISLILGSIIEDAQFLLATSGKEALELTQMNPDVAWVFIDNHLPDTLGTELLSQISAMKILAPVIIFSADDDAVFIDVALKEYASGFISKNAKKQEFIDCINKVEAGGTYLNPELRKQVNTYRQSILLEREEIEKVISERQREVLSLIVKGYSNAMIAQSLAVSESTVKTHVSAVLSLFHVENRTHCVAEAKRLGLIPK